MKACWKDMRKKETSIIWGRDKRMNLKTNRTCRMLGKTRALVEVVKQYPDSCAILVPNETIRQRIIQRYGIPSQSVVCRKQGSGKRGGVLVLIDEFKEMKGSMSDELFRRIRYKGTM